MPKKDKKAAKKDKGRDPADVVDAVRGAVERTFQATTGSTEGARDRGRSLLDDVASAAQRIRESFDDLRVLEDVKGLRAEIEALSRRVAELEKKQAAAPAAPARRRSRRPRKRAPARRSASRAKPAASRRRSPARRRPRSRAPRAPRPRPPARSPSPHHRGASRPRRAQHAAAARRQHLMAKVEFDSEDEFVEVIDEVFTMMDSDPEMGPKLRDADVPQRFEFTDLDLVVNIRAAEDGEDGNLHWEWSDEVDWEPKVKMAMSSETANKYFQGKENVAVALARRRIKSGGDVKAALSLIPITKPIYARYREYLEREHPHLVV